MFSVLPEKKERKKREECNAVYKFDAALARMSVLFFMLLHSISRAFLSQVDTLGDAVIYNVAVKLNIRPQGYGCGPTITPTEVQQGAADD